MSYNFSEVQLDSSAADVRNVANFRAFPLLLESVLMGMCSFLRDVAVTLAHTNTLIP